MHINHRRAKRRRHRSYNRALSLPIGAGRSLQRFAWKGRRQKIRLCLIHGAHDSIPTFYRKDIRWEYW